MWVEIAFLSPLHDKDEVTPFGECGLKLRMPQTRLHHRRHSLRGVWVEMSPANLNIVAVLRHSLRGVWVEIGDQAADQLGQERHSLRGVWVEI